MPSEYSKLPEDKKEKSREAALNFYYANRQKCAENAKRYREKNGLYIRDKQKADKRKRKLVAIGFLGSVCKDCGGSYPPAIYEFHHIDPKLKTKDPSKMLGLSLERLFKELDNCELLCANCHRLRHNDWT